MNRTLSILFITVFTSAIYAQEISPYRAEYLKGDISSKIQAVKKSASEGDMSLCLEAVDFAVKEKNVLSGDKDFSELIKTSLSFLELTESNRDEAARNKIIASLSSIFSSFNEEEIRLEALEKIMSADKKAGVSLLNSFLSGQISSGAKIDSVILKSIDLLKSYGDKDSFNNLFLADIIGIWSDYKDKIQDSYAPLVSDNEDIVLKVFTNVDVSKKIEILNAMNLLCENKKIPEKICGEIAENALSESIYNAGEYQDSKSELIKLQLSALQTIAGTKWTRAANLATDFFKTLRIEYEANSITSNEFAKAIKNITSVACNNTEQVFSSYLDFLNKGMEQNNPPDQAVVLSVINALGELGDKNAFDCLLYVTYLNYPENVIQEAKIALAKLKW